MDNGESSYRRFCFEKDESGLVEIIRDYKDGLIFFLRSFVGNILIAEELAEDTFVLLGTKKPKDKGYGSFKTWLYTIGRNIAIDYLRKNKRNNDICLDDTAELIASEEDLECSYIRLEQNIIIHRALNKLKPEYQQVIWLIYFEEMTDRECSVIMKKSVHNIDTLVYRARKALAKELEREGFDYYEDI